MKRLPLSLVVALAALLCFSHSIAAKDEWVQVRSKNFFLVGNASEKDIRKVATHLEEFRETFKLLFKNVNLVSPIPTNVIVFKSESSYKPFKPKRADGKIDNFVAGYFQSGDDVNYITLSVEGEDQETYRTIFHEYVHFIVNTNFGKAEVPQWFNEGLAEYHSTFAIENDQVVKLGLLIDNHLALMQQNKLLPLDQLFGTSNSQLSNTGDHSRTIFYAESWALIHYLVQGKKSAELAKFLDEVLKGVPREKAFNDAFSMDYAAMYSALKNYVGQSKYTASQYTFSKKLDFESEMQASPLPAAMSSAYLGDLLYHTNRADEAEPFLAAALKEDPSITMAATSLGMVKLRQRKFDEARQYLETAIKGDQKNAVALYRYAYLLSREGSDDYGVRREFSSETIAKMRDALRRAIAADPSFAETYDLLAYVDLTARDNYDEAAKAMTAALRYNPGSERFLIRLAEIYMNQDKGDDARKIVEKLSHSDDAGIQQRSAGILNYLDAKANYQRQAADFEMRRTAGSRPGRALTQDEVEKLNAQEALRSINEQLREPAAGETRVIGTIEKIDCSKRPLVYTVKTADAAFTVSSNDFENLVVEGFDGAPMGRQVGCEANLAPYAAVITYKDGPPTINNKGSRGELIAIEFVPPGFHLMSAAELEVGRPTLLHRGTAPADAGTNAVQIVTKDGAPPSEEEIRRLERESIRGQMRAALPQPGQGEKREMGFLDKIDCSAKGVYFVIRTQTGSLRLQNPEQARPQIQLFTQDLAGMQFGCGIKPVEYPAVVVYKVADDPKSKAQGTVVSLAFVPRDFTLE